MKLILPLIMLGLGIGGGVGAGIMLRPDVVDADLAAPEDSAKSAAQTHASKEGSNDEATDKMDSNAMEYVRLNNQFVVPLVTRDSVDALVVMALSVEIAAGNTEIVYRREPKLRDNFLQVLFDHANMGGFEGGFTDTNKLDVLRAALLEVAHSVIGPEVHSVLITDIGRQDM
ncbi:flagellar basal body-associated FliL family protein [Roseovarius sp. LXJ103]|uniref:flagellar basal body-associated FliL family protein n=1 Tax=Roseovarius carneus TaxID=2853164 RepID=UPI000D609573|nr:flagellar basal body-associated FliL family protein [Roseovarius carneus]MBZ8117541.1 flagellar basal body-associated FliL family protein [Roseovarius carneus]PWE36664.1 flagellar basal body-associated protein FliL [Pelagicola sp. LXJ1103]